MRTEMPEIVDKPFSGTVPPELPLLAITDAVVLPGVIMPYVVSDQKQVRMIHHVLSGNRMLAVFLKRDTKEDRLYEVGTAVQILRMFSVPDGSVGLLLQGVGRVRFNEIVSRDPFLVAHVESVGDDQRTSVQLEGYRKALLRALDKYIEFNSWINDDLRGSLGSIKESGRLADVICANLNFGIEDRQIILAALDNTDRVKALLEMINREVQLAELSRKIQSDLSKAMDKNQKEYYLREQIKVIRRELGDEEDAQVELEELRASFGDTRYPDYVRDTAEREIRRLGRMNPSTSEFSVARSYVDWLQNFPWGRSDDTETDIAYARKVLDRDHYGLEKIKERILEFLAVRKLTKDSHGPILCFTGPPGVGKTSLGKSIADALGRPFARLALGGVHDESEIRGHRRTYVGAMPGRIIQKLREADSLNPVFMLDEIDKLGADVKGDPAAALLEVLDPAQNNSFQDHYIDLKVDLSQVLFIATANQMDRVPGPLRDRMEVISLPGYLPNEKLEIATRYLVPRQVKDNGLNKKQLAFSAAGLRTIIDEYTREAGVRRLEQRIGAVARKVARQVAEDGLKTKVSVSANVARDLLGSSRILPEVANRHPEVGIATGLAWTAVGGVLLFIESTTMPGTGQLRLTGQLGDVMRESGEIARSYLRAHWAELGLPEDFHKNTDIHVHLPEGATPKDGPSAGITMVTCLVSLLSGRPVRHDLAMTGEISLRGKVMQIGGLREKVMAAHRAGIKTVLAPADNKKDLEDIPAEIRNGLNIILVSHIDEVLKHALVKQAKKSA